MTYDFDKITDRRGTGSLKWDVPGRELPMWVADMDFETAPEIIDALRERVGHGVFGYSVVPDEWKRAYVSWWERRHHFVMDEDALIFATGVVPAISSAVRRLTAPAENVLVLTPCYNIFFNSIRNNGRNIVECPLDYTGGRYGIDWDLFEQLLSDPQTTLMIFCNPHNPVGKIWTVDNLKRIGEQCSKYGVTVFSDEIHCDLTLPGREYVPFSSASETCAQISVTAIAPTKAFNLAGLQTAAVYAKNAQLRHRMWRQLNTDEVAEPNAFAVDATVAAFEHGEAWLDELREYLAKNREFAENYIRQNIAGVKPVEAEATYLMWLDCWKVSRDSDSLCDFIRKDSGLYLASGREYGAAGDGFLRLNLATQRSRLEDGMRRLEESIAEKSVLSYKKA